MEFVVRSPLSIAECTARLSSGFVGPIPKLLAKTTGRSVYGAVGGTMVEVTMAGLEVGPEGTKKRLLRPDLKAGLSLDKGQTVVSGEIKSSFGAGKTTLTSNLLGPVIVLCITASAVLDLANRWPILIASWLYLVLLGYFWLSDRRFTPSRREAESELLAWLETTIDGTRDSAPNAGV